MAATGEDTTRKIDHDTTSVNESDPKNKIDRNAPAGSPNSLGAESVRDGRPATDDSTVEAMDEVGPDVTVPTDTDKRR
jgi:hypothetical protein